MVNEHGEKPYETAEHRDARRQAYRTDDPRRCFEQAIGHDVHDRSYDRFLNETIAELRKEEENHGRRYSSIMPIAAELIEYWYNNAPETYMFRHPTPTELRQCFESHRPAAFWVRLLRMEHEAEKQEREQPIICNARVESCCGLPKSHTGHHIPKGDIRK